MTTRGIVRYKPRYGGARRPTAYLHPQPRTNPYFRNTAVAAYRQRKAPSGMAGIVFLVLIGICLAYVISQVLPKSTAVSNGVTSAQDINYSKVLVRIDQTDVSSYSDPSYFTKWEMSACSAASMTEIINAYKGTRYSISDVLAVETNFTDPVVLTTTNGLEYPGGIDRTMKHYGLVTTDQNYTLQQLIDEANAGTPVLISFPPQTWDGGHILVVVGGDGNYVHLADSSSLNMQYMTRTKFLKYWRGFAKTFSLPAQVQSVNIPAGQHSILGGPTLSADKINSILCNYSSPACNTGAPDEFYQDSVNTGISDAIALAFFGHESSYGKKGWGATNLSIGNIRCTDGYACGGGYRAYSSWQAGIDDWYQLIKTLYIKQLHLVTVEEVIPTYAPSADHNDEGAYINDVITSSYEYQQ